MRVLFAFLLCSFVLGGAARGRPFREHPMLLAGVATVVAASMYSLRVIL
ncbi:MAG: hypothetical protein R8G01_09255 [Ilumatobacteraceae bacterium]|nr:hypothetical protein [Ilumatobacteraceae bacterium]